MLDVSGPLDRPVDLARLLVAHGLTLRAAHRVVTQLSEGHQAPVLLTDVSPSARTVTAFAALGVDARIRSAPDSVDVKAIRQRLGLSQSDFAARFCFDVRTVQNWEQGRSTPDRYARTLLGTIARDPAAIERTLDRGD